MAVPPKALFENPTAFSLVSLSGELQALAAAVGSLGFISRAVQAPLLLAGEVNGARSCKAPWGEVDDVWGLGFSTRGSRKARGCPTTWRDEVDTELCCLSPGRSGRRKGPRPS